MTSELSRERDGGPKMTLRHYTAHVVGRKTYWRTASVVMACVHFNHIAGRPDKPWTAPVAHWFEASWQPKLFGRKVLTLRECFAKGDADG